ARRACHVRTLVTHCCACCTDGRSSHSGAPTRIGRAALETGPRWIGLRAPAGISQEPGPDRRTQGTVPKARRTNGRSEILGSSGDIKKAEGGGPCRGAVPARGGGQSRSRNRPPRQALLGRDRIRITL